MGFDKFIHTSSGKIILSVILGLGLSTLFRKACNERNCITFKAPPFKEIENKVFGFQNKCYKFKENVTKCNPSKQTVEFA
jgi:hypothetical protein